MIQRLSHATIYVTNQQQALEFYRDKLGFEVRTDAPMGEDRWLTVSPADQPDFEIILMEPKGGMMYDDATAEQIRSLVQKGVFGAGAFDTLNCQATYEELSKRGVEFLGPPKDEFYGISAVFKDNSGNWFSLTERKPE